jgi:RND family efflux transporter MFP subunit
VRIETVAAAPSLSKGRYTGTVQARQQVDLAFRAGGYVEKIAMVPGVLPGPAAGSVEGGEAGAHTKGKKPAVTKRQDRPIQAGDRVARDAVLASIRHSDFKQKLAEANGVSAENAAGLRRAKADLDRARTLLAEGTIPQAEFDAVKARHDSLAGASSAAAARVGQAGLALGDASLKAPFDGIVLERRVEIGALVAPGVPAIVLADTAMVKAVIGVPDGVQRELALGQEVLVSSDAVPDKTFNALITKIAAQADSRTRVFEVEATLDNSEGLLKVGMVATVTIGKGAQEPANRRSSCRSALS